MAICSVCERILPTPLDEYGDPRKPVCFDHFMSQQAISDTQKKFWEERIEDLENEIDDVEGQIDDLHNTLYELRRELRKANEELNGTGTKTKFDEKRRLEAWIKGLAKIAKDTNNDKHRTPLLQLN